MRNIVRVCLGAALAIETIVGIGHCADLSRQPDVPAILQLLFYVVLIALIVAQVVAFQAAGSSWQRMNVWKRIGAGLVAVPIFLLACPPFGLVLAIGLPVVVALTGIRSGDPSFSPAAIGTPQGSDANAPQAERPSGGSLEDAALEIGGAILHGLWAGCVEFVKVIARIPFE